MDAYFDSAIIVKLYVQEATSPDAIRLVSPCATPYILTPWQALEVRNAIRLKRFRGEITITEMEASIESFRQDIAAGRWIDSTWLLTRVQSVAEELSVKHSATIGSRTLDILHVASALVSGAKEFITFDARQGALAKEAGLIVKP